MKERYLADYLPSGVEFDQNNLESVIEETLEKAIREGCALNSISHDECYNICFQVINDYQQWETVAYYDIEGNEI